MNRLNRSVAVSVAKDKQEIGKGILIGFQVDQAVQDIEGFSDFLISEADRYRQIRRRSGQESFWGGS